MKPDNRNYFLAIGLSILVVFVWNYFYAGPQMARMRQQQVDTAAVGTLKNGAPGAVPPQTVNAPPQGGVGPQTPETAKSRDAALAESPRVTIDTPKLKGSIALKGARIDDIALKDYRETTDPNSSNIILFSPPNAPTPYYAETGFVAPQGATNITLPKPDTLWTADKTALTPATPVVLSWDNGAGLIFHRTISIDSDYMISISDAVENKTASPVVLYPHSFIVRKGVPPTSGYSVLHEGFIGVIGDNGEQEITYSGIEKEPNAIKSLRGTGGWIGFTDKYWAATLIPDQKQSFAGSYSATGTAQKIFQTDTFGEAMTVPANGGAESNSRVFAGAKVVSLLNNYETSLAIKKFDLLIDWGWFFFLTKPMFALIDGIYKIVGNFGLAIIAVTVLVKAVFYPLANRSYMSMAKMKMAQPQLAALKERYPDDKVKQQQEMMAIYKREKINPVAGCLPMVIQIPVFFSLYKVLFVTIEMRQAPFYGWIHDLSQPDPTNIFNLFGLLPYDPTALPLIGHFLAIGIWPLVMGFSMFVQMKMNPAPTDPVQKQMFAWMPVIFTFMLGTFPSGLVIYWTVNNTLTVIQQSLIMKSAGQKLELFDNLKGLFGKKKPAPPTIGDKKASASVGDRT